MRNDDVCRCPGEHRLVLLGTCWRCLGRVTDPRPATASDLTFRHSVGAWTN